MAQTLGSALANIVDVAKFGRRLHQVELLLVAFGLKAVGAIVVFVVGRWLISLVTRLILNSSVTPLSG